MHVVALLAKTFENGHYPTHIVEAFNPFILV